MSGKSVILKPEKRLILPSEMPAIGKDVGIVNIPMNEAIRRGLAHPPHRTKGKRYPAVPAGMGIFAKYAIQILDEKKRPVLFRHPKTGKMVKKLEQPVHSFNRNFGFFIRGFMQNVDGATLNQNETLTDDTGASFQIRVKAFGTGAIAIISGLCKIKFGNSSAALATTQVNLQGVLLGPTTEAACTVTLIVEDSTNTIFTVAGQITNGTGGAFSVEEMGLFPELGSFAGVANTTTMMLRDLTGTVNVNNGQTIIGTYTFTIAV